MTLDEKFQDALKRLDALPNQPSHVLLDLYGLYKQSLVGDATGDAPSKWNMRAHAKFEAWTSHQGTSTEDAKSRYIQYVDELVAKHAAQS